MNFSVKYTLLIQIRTSDADFCACFKDAWEMFGMVSKHQVGALKALHICKTYGDGIYTKQKVPLARSSDFFHFIGNNINVLIAQFDT